MKRYNVGESCIVWSFGNTMSLEMTNKIAGIYSSIKSNINNIIGIYDIVPSYNTIAIHFNPLQISEKKIIKKIEKLIKKSTFTQYSSKTIEIGVIYNGEDLKRVADINSLTIDEVISIHSEKEYTIGMIGFVPHFPYLLGMDDRISTPRLDNPRKQIPAKSVAIGGNQTGIYPSISPGGWNLIGTVDKIPINLEIGDKIIFKVVG